MTYPPKSEIFTREVKEDIWEIAQFLKLHPELARDRYSPQRGSLRGHCYVASEAFWHMHGKRLGWSPKYAKDKRNNTHWFLVDNMGNILDITGEQYPSQELVELHERGIGCGFFTTYPSRRAREVIDYVTST